MEDIGGRWGGIGAAEGVKVRSLVAPGALARDDARGKLCGERRDPGGGFEEGLHVLGLIRARWGLGRVARLLGGIRGYAKGRMRGWYLNFRFFGLNLFAHFLQSETLLNHEILKFSAYFLDCPQPVRRGPSLRGSMTATVDGKPWAANCKNSVNGQLAAVVYNSDGTITIFGLEVSSPGDTSYITMTYDQYLNPGQQQAIGPGEEFLSYVTKTDVYSSESQWGSGTFYWTDQTNDIQGSFDGTIGDAQNNTIEISVDFDAPKG